MRPSIYWLDLPEAGRLAIMPRPRAGDWLLDEIACWKREAINVVVSLLEQHEVDDLELSTHQYSSVNKVRIVRAIVASSLYKRSAVECWPLSARLRLWGLL